LSSDLDALAPEAAVGLYLDHRKGELSDATYRSHRARLRQFVEWCEDQDITNLNDVTGRDLHAYRVDRREDGDLKPISLKTQLSTLRIFIDWCASMEAVPESLSEKIMLPTVPDGEERSKTNLDADRGEAILDWLGKYKYASRNHVVFALLWRTGMRTGALRGLDLGDYDRDGLALEVRHRPEQGTPIKNKERGERDVALSPNLANVLDDYISGVRKDVTDEHRREPLVTTAQGRPHRSTVREVLYRLSRPCHIGEPCPHDRDPDTCEAAKSELACKCASARSPHDARSGAITAHLLDDIPVEIVSERMDVTMDVLDKHYDRRSKREKMEQRRQFLDGVGS